MFAIRRDINFGQRSAGETVILSRHIDREEAERVMRRIKTDPDYRGRRYQLLRDSKVLKEVVK